MKDCVWQYLHLCRSSVQYLPFRPLTLEPGANRGLYWYWPGRGLLCRGRWKRVHQGLHRELSRHSCCGQSIIRTGRVRRFLRFHRDQVLHQPRGHYRMEPVLNLKLRHRSRREFVRRRSSANRASRQSRGGFPEQLYNILHSELSDFVCNVFHATHPKVASGDSCTSVDEKYDIALADLLRWNTALTAACTTIEVGEAYCTGGGGNPCTDIYTASLMILPLVV